MQVYYAHCMAIYGKPQEARDIATLKALGFEVVNPADKAYDQMWKDQGMAFAKSFARACDAIAFRALPDGRIPAGVFKEIAMFLRLRKPVIELPSNFIGRKMSLAQTREYLKEIGQR